MRDQLTAEYVRGCLDYCPDTGVFTRRWRPREHFPTTGTWKITNGRFAGRVCGGTDGNGYAHISITCRGINHHCKAHRLAWLYVYGEWPKEQIDHINGVRDDNRISNLRSVTKSENGRNQKLPSTNSSGIIGVSWHSRDNYWQARIAHDGRRLFLGKYDTILDAAAARKSAELKYKYHPNHGRAGVPPHPQ